MEFRTVAVILHPDRADALEAAGRFIAELHHEGFHVYTFADDVERLSAHAPGCRVGPLGEDPTELAVVFGGDGSMLAAAEWSQPLGVPVLGVNLGHVGFLAELETSDIDTLYQAVIDRAYSVEERVALHVAVHAEGQPPHWRSIAINEVSMEKLARERMINVLVSVDDHRLSRWGCDGVLVSTPTGSTAYAFSAGGPVVWPDVQAKLLVPLSAHALFNRPMVLSPTSTVQLDLAEDASAVIWCDGRRTVNVNPGEMVRVTTSDRRLLIARLSEQPFTTRLVRKFALPVEGWRRPRQEQ